MNHIAFPPIIHILAVTSIIMAVVCSLLIAVDQLFRPQRMWIMGIVWPLTTLFGSLLWLAAYFRWGRTPADESNHDAESNTPMPVSVGKAASHCGAGCALGDLLAEWLAWGFPALAAVFGWHWLFAEKIFAVWIFDFVLAFLIGIAFQYFTITPMRDIRVRDGITQAIKADVTSISAWQIGMYGMMALIQFGWFKHAFGATAPVNSPEFWFAMQIAMIAGFMTSYPVNWLLVAKGVKERM